MKRFRIMKPYRIWIDGRTFEQKKQSDGVKQETPDIKQLYNIIEDENGTFSTSFRLPNAYYGKLHKDPNFNIKQFENCTNTTLALPNRDKQGNMSISGTTMDCIAKAREEMHSLIIGIRSALRPIQFISIPTLSEEVQTNFKKFKLVYEVQEVLNLPENKRCVEDSIFQKSEKLHITVFVLCLLDETETAKAATILEKCKVDILDPMLQEKGPLSLKIQGLDCMTNNHENAHVLYAKAHFENETDDFNLQKVLDQIQTRFYEEGLLKEMKDNVKIHVTLMNTKYRIGNNNWKRKRTSFDATEILNKYGDYYFGITPLDKINVSLISTKGEDGFYKSISSINF